MFLFRSSQNSSDDPHSAATAVVGDLGMRGRSPARPIALLIACGITLIAAIAGGIATLVAELHHRALTDSGREMGNIALVLAAQVDRTFQALEVAQDSVIERMQTLGIASRDDFERRMSGEDVHLMLKHKISGLPHVARIGLVNADGKLINFSSHWPTPNVTFADRDFFKKFQSDPRLTTYVSEPVLSRDTGHWTVLLAKRFAAPSGEFLGLVTGVIDLQYVESFFGSILLGEHSSIALLRSDGMVLVRYPRIEATVGKTVDRAISALGGGERGTLRVVGKLSHKDRLLAAHRVAHYPLVISVGNDIAAILAEWQNAARLLIISGCLAAFVIGTVVILIVRQLLQGHRWSKQRFALEKLRLDTALNNMSQGLCMFDSAARLILCNQRYIQMYGLSPEVAKPGCTVRELVEHRKETGSFAGDPEQYCSALLSAVAEGKTVKQSVDMPDGRTIHVVNQPMANGGWVATHEDVTERRRAERERDRNREFLDLILDNVPVSIIVKEANERRFVLLNRAGEKLWGLSRTEALGKTPHELFPAAQADLITQRDDELMQSDSPVFFDEHPNLARPDDGRILTSTRLAIRGDDGKPQYLVSVIEDVTERKRAEKERDRNREFLDLIIENVPTTIVVKEARDFRYVLINRAGEEYYGVPRDKMIGRTAHDILPPAAADLVTRLDRRVLETYREPLLDEHEIETPGHGMRTSMSKRLLISDDKGEPQYLLAVIDDVTERKRAERKIAHMAHHDALTDLPNRVLLHKRLEQELSHVRRGARLSVLYLDLDHFKRVNDTLGHSTGDELLKAVADRLRGCVRDVDLVARFGGDEFAVIQTELERPADAAILAQRLRDAMQTPYEVNGHQIVIDASIGIALSPDDGTDPDQLLKNADMALYGAKSDGRGAYRYFEPEMDARMKARRALELDLRKAIANGEFELYYQPVVNLQSNAISGCEGLLRWHHPERGMVSPAEFIPVAEETGLIVPIGEWVLRQACADAATWPDGINVAVNLSAAQFRYQTLARAVIGSLAASGLPPHRLELEITESVLMQNNEATVATLHQLRQLGVRIAMDDFGTGYSSLSYLRSFPFDKIKIDRSFINDLSDKGDSFAIVQAITRLARRLNMATTAEGIETEQQLENVRAVGCTEMQGYLFSPPGPVQRIARLFPAPPDRLARVG
jgi:diguanylate cyclase (GGDEF)-like protein/PAS domain S-box-containing protein